MSYEELMFNKKAILILLFKVLELTLKMTSEIISNLQRSSFEGLGGFIYNVTIKVTWAIHKEWVEWMQTKHISDVMATGCFTKYVFAKLIDIDEEEGPTYTCQYYAASKEEYDTYITKHSEALRQDGFAKWGNQFIAFRTLMQVVN